MNSHLSVLNELASVSSVNEKIKIIEANKDDNVFVLICHMAYEPSLSYFISRPKSFEASQGECSNIKNALSVLLDFASGDFRGNVQQEMLLKTLSTLSPDDAEVVCRILDHDLKCGINVSLINRVCCGLISTFDFLLCDTDASSIVYPAISQIKADGVRCKVVVDTSFKSVVAMSRQGKRIELFHLFDEELLRIAGDRCIKLDGELVCHDEKGRPLPRKESNGILNKAIKGTISRHEAEMIRFIVWDQEDYTSTIPYSKRFSELSSSIESSSLKLVVPIETRLVSSYDEALDHFKDARRRNLEGTIVKNLDGKWVPKRSKDLCKFKAEIEGDFRVIGFEYGTGKNSRRIGALHVESECGMVKSKVGIFKDFNESVRDEWLVDLPEIVTVMYNERITDKNRKDGTESLFLPRITAVRNDKRVANTRSELIDIEKSIIAGG